MYQCLCKFIVRQVNYSFFFAVKLSYGGREGIYFSLFVFKFITW